MMTEKSSCHRLRDFMWMVLPATLAFSILGRQLQRELWFDEALTLLNFALLPDSAAIWRNYVIPNNQLLHTVLLHYWIAPAQAFPCFTAGLRLLPVLLSVLTVFLLGMRLRRTGWAGALVLTSFVLSCVFRHQGAALRGYALSGLLVWLTFLFAEKAACGRKPVSFVCCFLVMWGALATIPTNLLAVSAAVILAFAGRKPLKNGAFLVLVFSLPVAFFLSYGPIFSSLVRVSRLGEGWSGRGAASAAVYGAVFASFGLLLIPAIWGGSRRFNRSSFLWRCLVWAMPLAPIWLLPVAPFPRIFYPFFPLWVFLVAHGVSKGMRRLFPVEKKGRALLVAVVAGWTFLMVYAAPHVSDRWFDCGRVDDYFDAYYMREEFVPSELCEWISARHSASSSVPSIYVSFRADPWAVLFAASGFGFRVEFDGPVKKAEDSCSWAVFLKGENPLETEKRFREKNPLFAGYRWAGTLGRWDIYRSEYRNCGSERTEM